jgi:hypothetical protein
VAHAGRRTRFAQETKPRRFVTEMLFTDDFQCHGASKIDVERFVGYAHRAATQLDRSPVFADYYLIVVKSSCHVWRFRLDHALRRRLVGFDSASESLAKHAHRTEFHCSGKLITRNSRRRVCPPFSWA